MTDETPIAAVELEAVENDGLLLAARLMEELCGGPVPVVGASEYATAIVRAFAAGQAVAQNRAADRRTCRVCGCWDLHPCDDGCGWAGETICTRCAPNNLTMKAN